MAETSQTVVYDPLLTTTLNNYQKKLVDNVSTANALFWLLNKHLPEGYEGESDLGDRMQMALMYELAEADFYAGYDKLSTQPTDGMTAAFFPWFQLSVPITISGIEEKKNRGEARMINLLEGKMTQAEQGIKTLLSKALIQGRGLRNPAVAGDIMYRCPRTAGLATGPDPLFRLIQVDPTSNTAGVKMVGEIDQSLADNAYWRNITVDFAGITKYHEYLAKLRHFYNLLHQYDHGKVELWLSDLISFELYEAALAEKHQNPSYQKADIPFDAVEFKGKPWVNDVFFPEDVAGGLVTDGVSPTGAIVGINPTHLKLKYDKETNFATTPFVKPGDQDAKVAQILWLGGWGMDNRRSQGVGHGIPRTLAA